MDPMILAGDLVDFLSPFFPYLVKVGEKAAEEAGKKLGVSAWERAKTLWSKLRPKVEAKIAAREAVQDVAKTPNDEDARTVLRVQLKKLLIDNEALVQEISELMGEKTDMTASVIINQEAGDNAIQIGQVSGDASIRR